MKKCLLILSVILLSLLVLLYIALLNGLPALVNSHKFQQYIKKTALERLNIILETENMYLSVSRSLNTTFEIKRFKVKDKSDNVAIAASDLKIYSDIKKLSVNNINASLIDINLDNITKILPDQKPSKNKKSKIKLSNIPNCKIDKIKISKNDKVKLNSITNNFEIKRTAQKTLINLKTNLTIDRVIEPIVLGDNGQIYIEKNKLFADKYSLKLENKATFSLNGNLLDGNQVGNINIKGDNIQIKDLMQVLLFLQKYTDPTKKFIENFKDYKGVGSVVVNYENNILSGYAKLVDVEAKTVKYSIPLKVKNAEFYLKNNELNSFVEGKAGNERITHKLHIANILSPNRIASGEVKVNITKPMVAKYLPKDIKLKNYIDLTIDYEIQNRKVRVKYNALLPKNTDLIWHNYSAGLTEKNRVIKAETYKDGINLFLNNYSYALLQGDAYNDIVTGDGFFINDNGKLSPQYVTCKTNGFVPNSFAGSFGNYVTGGQFNGSIKYVIPKKQLIGNFEVIDTVFNSFNVKSAKVLGDENLLKVFATGKYKNEQFTCKGDAKNDFRGKIYVNNMDLFLDKFIIKKSTTKNTNIKPIDLDKSSKQISSNVRKINMDIDKWQIRGNTLNIKGISINNILLQGSLKNSIFKYGIPKLEYANGEITAEGIYDFNVDSSIIDFSAKNIDSNIIATEFFNFPNQIKGLATAKLHSQTHKDLRDWKAYATFEIDNGALPQLESIEFSPNKLNPSKKVKISDYVKCRASKKGNVQSKITGSFSTDEVKIYDVDVRLQHEFISSFVTGTYNYLIGNETINLYGKYDNSVVKQIKVIGIPLNWIINTLVLREKAKDTYKNELSKIPPIGIQDTKAKYFKIEVKGNPSDINNLEVDVKILKN